MKRYSVLISTSVLLLTACCDCEDQSTRPCDEDMIIYMSQDLSGHIISAECNPGGGTICPCSNDDVSIASFGDYGEVTSNVQYRNTYVNAIGHKKFEEVFPTGELIALCKYKYSGQFQLPILPFPDANQTQNPQAIHMMIQLWDGRDALFTANRKTLEAAIYYEVNPWHPDYGKIKIYRNPVQLIDTSIRIPPDTSWHTFELVADFRNKSYISISIDGQNKDLSSVELAQVSQPTWGKEVAINITTESLASWPQTNCSTIFTWTTRFRNIEFQYFGQ